MLIAPPSPLPTPKSFTELLPFDYPDYPLPGGVFILYIVWREGDLYRLSTEQHKPLTLHQPLAFSLAQETWLHIRSEIRSETSLFWPSLHSSPVFPSSHTEMLGVSSLSSGFCGVEEV